MNGTNRVSKKRRAAASSSLGNRRAARHGARQSPTRPQSTRLGNGSKGAASGRLRKRAQDLRNGGTAAATLSSRHPASCANGTRSSVRRGGPISRANIPARSRRRRAAPRRGSEHSGAARRHQDPIRIGQSRIARKGPGIDFLARMFGVAIDDLSRARPRHVDLLRDELDRHMSDGSVEAGPDDIGLVDPQQPGLERLPGGLALSDRRGKGAVDILAEQGTQGHGVAFRKGIDDHRESGPRPVEKTVRIKTRVGATQSGQPGGDRVLRRRGRARDKRGLAALGERHYLVRGALREGIAAALEAGPSAEHAAQPEDQKSGDHRKQDDVEILTKPAHPVPCPAGLRALPEPDSVPSWGLDRLFLRQRQACRKRARCWRFRIWAGICGCSSHRPASLRMPPARAAAPGLHRTPPDLPAAGGAASRAFRTCPGSAAKPLSLRIGVGSDRAVCRGGAMSEAMRGNGQGGEPAAATEPYQLIINAQYVKDLSFENPRAPQSLIQPSTQPQVDINVDVNARNLAPEVFEVALTINASARVNNDPIFLVELVYGAVVTVKNAAEAIVPTLVLVETPRIIFPFARAVIADATRDGGFPPLMINPIDFAALLRRQQSAAAAVPSGGEVV